MPPPAASPVVPGATPPDFKEKYGTWIIIGLVVAAAALILIWALNRKGSSKTVGKPPDAEIAAADERKAREASAFPAPAPAAQPAPSEEEGQPLEELSSEELKANRPIGHETERVADFFLVRLGDRGSLHLDAGGFTEWFYTAPQVKDADLKAFLANGDEAKPMGVEKAAATIGGGRYFRFKEIAGETPVSLKMSVRALNKGYRKQ